MREVPPSPTGPPRGWRARQGGAPGASWDGPVPPRPTRTPSACPGSRPRTRNGPPPPVSRGATGRCGGHPRGRPLVCTMLPRALPARILDGVTYDSDRLNGALDGPGQPTVNVETMPRAAWG